MSIFFRVHDNKDDPGTLYDRRFILTTTVLPTESDLVLSATRAQWTKILAANPTDIVLRVHEDKLNHDINQGELYDENFERVSKHTLKLGNPVLFTVTPDEFKAVTGSKGNTNRIS